MNLIINVGKGMCGVRTIVCKLVGSVGDFMYCFYLARHYILMILFEVAEVVDS